LLTKSKIANIKVYKKVKQYKKIIKDGRQVTVSTMINEEIRLKWSDRFWQEFVKYYAKVMEGMIPIVSHYS
jgi:hypothetical protein